MSSTTVAAPDAPSRIGWLYAVVPIGLLLLTLAAIVITGAGLRDNGAPPIETLAIDRVTLPAPNEMKLSVINDGPDAVTIAQVMVDDAYWEFTQEPAGEIGRRDRVTISLPYPWVEGESHAIALVSSTGVLFDAAVPVAIESPTLDRQNVVRYGLIGIYVGIVPVVLGLLWYPLLRRLGRAKMNFILALTVGLLLFLVVDMFQEAQEVAADAPASFGAPVLVPLLAVLAAGALITLSRWLGRRGERLRGQSNGELDAGVPDRSWDRFAQSGRRAGDRQRVFDRRSGAGRLSDRRIHAAQCHRRDRDRGAACRKPTLALAFFRTGIAGGRSGRDRNLDRGVYLLAILDRGFPGGRRGRHRAGDLRGWQADLAQPATGG